MKKITAILTAVMMLLTCFAAFAEQAAEQVGLYTIYNMTDEKVVELTLTDNITGEASSNFAADGLDAGAVLEISQSLAAGEDGSHRYTLTFKTEGGYEGTFATLSIEEAPITLLSEDAMTGATMIAFKIPEQTGVYTLYNTTGEKVTEITLTDNVTGEVSENFAPDGLDNGDVLAISAALPATEDGSHRFTLSFKTESGYEGTFATLSIEVAPITLLSTDAMTGATMVAFKVPQQTGTYTIYNKTGEKVTDLYLTDNLSGEQSENFASEGIEADGTVEISTSLPINEDGSHRFTLSFKTEGGYEGTFATLSIEVVPITLLSADAMTGATMISFSSPAE